MKKRITALALAMVMVMGTAVMAASTEKSISVTPMKLTINGQEVAPTKSDGTPAEVFAYDGATYVPLRYLSELLGVQVDWDPATPDVAKLISDKITLPAPAAVTFIPGTYTGEGQGFGGTIKVAVTLSATGIETVEVTENSETQGIGSPAIEKLPAKIVEAQSTQVDTITGATFASKGVIEAVDNALKSAGIDPAALTPAENKPSAGQAEDRTTDIVVVGAGGAGVAAAISAADKGAQVILVEKLSGVGGTTAMASTAYNAGGSAIQMTQEKPYTADDYYAKLTSGVGYDDPRNRNLADLSGPTCDWLVDLGADLGKVQNGSQHTTTDGSAFGPALVGALSAAMDKRAGIELITDTKATAVLMDGTKAVGVTVEGPNGTYNINAGAVILATGGFASNPEMVAKYTPEWAGYPSTASVGATGDGILMAQTVGAGIDLMDLAGPQTVAYDTGNGAVSLTNVRYNGAIIINAEGKRFVNELGLTSLIGTETKKQTGGYGFLVFDQASVDRAALMQTYKDRGYFVQADTIEELAQKLGVDEDELAKTVTTYQGYYDAGEDAEFGRKDSMFSRLDKAPFYGAKISPASQTTYGGILIDLQTRVLREDKTVIDGLYAAGETTAQYGQGTTIAVALGKLSGEVAADAVVGK